MFLQTKTKNPKLEIRPRSTTGNTTVFDIWVDGKVWFTNTEAAVMVNGNWKRTASSDIQCSTDAVNYKGEDSFGKYQATMSPCTLEEASIFNLTIREYYTETIGDGNMIIFEQSFTSTVPTTGGTDCDQVTSRYPYLSPAEPSSLGYLTFSGNQSPDFEGLLSDGTLQGKMGLEGGVPLVLFNDSDAQPSVLMAPVFNSMGESQIFDSSSETISCGILGCVKSIPRGYQHQTMLYAAYGVTATVQGFGGALRAHYGKKVIYDDFTVTDLGYYTDNGAYYYYNTEKDMNYAETLSYMRQVSSEKNIPFNYAQLDSWWYYQGPHSGVTNWSARPDVFPHGIVGVHEDTQWSFVAHNRYWSADNIYATQNGGNYQFYIDEDTSTAVPLGQQLWEDLFKNATLWGLRTYEQDWLDHEVQNVDMLRQDVFAGRNWLQLMDSAATQYGINIQYCMPFPRHVIQSAEMKAVSQMRASNDYHPNNDQWKIGVTSLLVSSVGAAPFKDTFWSSSDKQPNNPYGKDTIEPATLTEALVATLSTGPVGPSDKADMLNEQLIMRSCRKDGVLLKPDQPAIALDRTYRQRSFGHGGPDGEVWQTTSQLGSQVWGIVVAFELHSKFNVSPDELQIALSENDDYCAWTIDANDTASVCPFSKSNPIVMQSCDKTEPQIWNLAPVTEQLVLLGEIDKFVPMSGQRIESIQFASGTITVALKGAQNETVNFAYYKTSSDSVHRTTCNIGIGGKALLTLPKETCQNV